MVLRSPQVSDLMERVISQGGACFCLMSYIKQKFVVVRMFTITPIHQGNLSNINLPMPGTGKLTMAKDIRRERCDLSAISRPGRRPQNTPSSFCRLQYTHR